MQTNLPRVLVRTKDSVQGYITIHSNDPEKVHFLEMAMGEGDRVFPSMTQPSCSPLPTGRHLADNLVDEDSLDQPLHMCHLKLLDTPDRWILASAYLKGCHFIPWPDSWAKRTLMPVALVLFCASFNDLHKSLAARNMAELRPLKARCVVGGKNTKAECINSVILAYRVQVIDPLVAEHPPVAKEIQPFVEHPQQMESPQSSLGSGEEFQAFFRV